MHFFCAFSDYDSRFLIIEYEISHLEDNHKSPVFWYLASFLLGNFF